MDQDVIHLAKAIRQQESNNNFNAVGDNGTSHGAYQFQDATWKMWAKEHLGNENAEKTPANQNAVAYSTIKKWKDGGLNPAQIAAKWNSGSEKGWESKIGTTTINGKPLAYDVPSYVKNVTGYYHKFKNEDVANVRKKNTTPVALPAEQKPDYLGEISSAGKSLLQKGIQPTQDTITASSNDNLASRALQGASSGVSGAVNVGGSLVEAGANALTGGYAGKIGGEVSEGIGNTISSSIDKIPDQYKQTAIELVQKHPELARDAAALSNLVLTFAGGSAGRIVNEKVGKVIGSNLVSKGIHATKEQTLKGAEAVVKNISKRSEKKITNKITETIMPKPTIGQAKLAESQGRLVKGKDRTFFRQSKPDSVIPTDKTKQSVETIKKYIPNPHKMKGPELYTALDKKTVEIAKKLEPEMKAVPISKETVTKIRENLKKLNDKLIKSADASDEANVIKENKQFEERLSKINQNKVSDIVDKARSGELTVGEFTKNMKDRISKIESSSMDDLHKARIEYDNSIPDNVKNADSLSSASLQDKRVRWIQRRAIFNDAIHDTESGLGETSRKAFSDMSDMYNAKQQILSNAKIETTIKPSKFKEIMDGKTGKFIKYGGGALLGNQLVKKTTGFGF